MRIDEVLQRIQGEYLEMPGLRLTPAQAQRLWGLERDVCDALLAPLSDEPSFWSRLAIALSCEWRGARFRAGPGVRAATIAVA